MKIRDSFGWISIILFVVGVITYIMKIGQGIEIQYLGNVTTSWICLMTWGASALSVMIIWIFDRGYEHGKHSLEKEREREQKSFMERKT